MFGGGAVFSMAQIKYHVLGGSVVRLVTSFSECSIVKNTFQISLCFHVFFMIIYAHFCGKRLAGISLIDYCVYFLVGYVAYYPNRSLVLGILGVGIDIDIIDHSSAEYGNMLLFPL